MPGVDEIRIEYVGMLAPIYASKNASGADLFANISISCTIKVGNFTLIPTGIKVAIPIGYEGQVRPRSGLALQYGITVLNTPGTIDADYRGEIRVLLINLGIQDFVVEPHQRIAQLVITPVVRANFYKVTELGTTARNNCGYGSTGIF